MKTSFVYTCTMNKTRVGIKISVESLAKQHRQDCQGQREGHHHGPDGAGGGVVHYIVCSLVRRLGDD